jgi:hypothetical protein
MRLKWRMWLKSWWVWAAIVCFGYLCLFGEYALRIEALWPWAWPWSRYIVFGSLLLAVLILDCIGAYVLVYHMAGPSLTSLAQTQHSCHQPPTRTSCSICEQLTRSPLWPDSGRRCAD